MKNGIILELYAMLCYAMLCYEPMLMLIMLQGYKDIYLPVTFIYIYMYVPFIQCINKQTKHYSLQDRDPPFCPLLPGHSPIVGNITVSWTLSQCGQHHSLMDTLSVWATSVSWTLSHCGQHHSLLDTLPVWATSQSPRHSPSVGNITVS